MNREKPGNSFYKKKDIANRMLRRNLGGPYLIKVSILKNFRFFLIEELNAH